MNKLEAETVQQTDELLGLERSELREPLYWNKKSSRLKYLTNSS